jgi:CDP-glycerol glycerophosphotransferase (TagB/SpsB family)
MTEARTYKDKVLLLAYTRNDVLDILPLLEEFKKDRTSAIVLGLDYGSFAELRRRKIRYRSPMEYLDARKCQKMDAEAVDLARNWYRSIDDKLSYHQISLGEMVEYDFVFLFMDALRAVEIANCIIEVERPTKIFLPQNVPQAMASAVRYEALSSAVLHVAGLKEIPVSYVPSTRKIRFIYAKAKKVLSFLKISTRYLLETAVQVRTLSRVRKLRGKPSREFCGTVVFVDVPEEIFQPIKKELERSRRIIAVRAGTPLILLGGAFETWKSVEMEKGFVRDLVYGNVKLEDILARRFSRFLLKDSKELVVCIRGTEKLIGYVEPKMIVTMEDITPHRRVITRVCRNNGVRTLVIQHGILSTDVGGFHVMPVEADVQAVWGNASIEWATKRGKPSKTQVATGNPKYDLIASRRSVQGREKIALYRKLGLDSRKGTVVVATDWYVVVACSYTPEDAESFMRDTLTAMKAFPDKQVVVKLHPTMWEEFEQVARAIIDELQIRNVVVTRNFLWELLETCDLLITMGSTVGLEAILFDKPVITYNRLENIKLNPYAETDFVINVYEREKLIRAIRDALYSTRVRGMLADARKKSVYEYVHLQDGKASERVADLIEHMICS